MDLAYQHKYPETSTVCALVNFIREKKSVYDQL